MKSVLLTDVEIRITVELIDECVKAKGLLVAAAALQIVQKLKAATPVPPPETKEETAG